LGFPTGWSFTTHKDYCWGTKKNNLPCQLAISYFSGAVAGEEVEDFYEGSFRTHILYFVIVLFCFTLFILPASFYIKNPKKLESLVVAISLLLVHHAVP
jgi:hypothetical protein